MWTKLKIILPIAQVVIAIGLLILAHQQLKGTSWGRTGTSWNQSAGGAPARRICIALNAPVIFFHNLGLWDRVSGLGGGKEPGLGDRTLLSGDDFIWLIGIALLWYLIGLIIELKLRKRKNLVLAFTPLRVGFDLILVFMAITFAAGTFDSWFEAPGWAISVVTATLFLAWTFGLLVYCGYDTVSWIKERRLARNSST